jgi:hypothetical protein
MSSKVKDEPFREFAAMPDGFGEFGTFIGVVADTVAFAMIRLQARTRAAVD